MSKTVDELLIQVTLNAKQLQQSLNSAEQNISRFADKITSVMSVALEAIALKFSLSFGKSLVETFATTGSKLHFLSQQVGESVGTLDKWGVAVQKAGGSTDTFFNTINNLHNKLVDMKYNGDLKTASIFGLMGINTTGANGELKKASDVLLEISKFFKGKTTNQQQFFGRQLGLDDATIRLLAKGEQETLKLVNAQKQLWNEKSAAQAERQREKLIQYDRAIEQLKITIAEKLLPYANQFINWVQRFVNEHGTDLANIIDTIVSALADMAGYIPTITGFIGDLNKSLGITGKDLGKILVSLLALKAAKDVFSILASGAKLLSTELVAITAAFTTIKWVYDKYQEFKKNPDAFNTEDRSLTNWQGKLGRLFKMGESAGGAVYDIVSWAQGMVESGNKAQIGYAPEELDTKLKKAIPESGITKFAEWMQKKTGIGFTTDQANKNDFWGGAIKWAQGMVESGNKSQIGYAMQKDASGRYQYKLDAKGNKIPEAYGKYQIKPSTASEVMGRKVTGNELMNDDFNTEVHDKLMAKWTKQFGSQEAALAYYNAGQKGLDTYRKTGTTSYLDKIKSYIPNALAAQGAQQAITQANQNRPQQASSSNVNMNIHSVNVKADSPQELVNDLMSKVPTGMAFNTGLRTA